MAAKTHGKPHGLLTFWVLTAFSISELSVFLEMLCVNAIGIKLLRPTPCRRLLIDSFFMGILCSCIHMPM